VIAEAAAVVMVEVGRAAARAAARAALKAVAMEMAMAMVVARTAAVSPHFVSRRRGGEAIRVR